jgi:5-methyltetrahydrofolate--homocysteine methyltransferase
MHTAVKISPCYSSAEHPVVHVLDASRAVTVVRSLISAQEKLDYAEDVLERYQEMRDEYNATATERKCLSLKDAQSKRFDIDFTAQPPAPAPKQLGVTILDGYSVEDVIPYIDWEPFFLTWDLKGRYPNKGFPNIFKDARVGEEAKKIYDDAQSMLKEIIAAKNLTLKGVVGLFPANRSEDGEDVEVFADPERTKVAARFCMLRQQIAWGDKSERHLSQADFIAPRGHADHFGMFAVACFGADELADKYKANKDDFSRIMVQALADRFVEAFAELVHKDIRTKLWGYAPDEDLKPEDLLKVRYAGIRPAPGYPSQPDHTEKKTMWDLMQVKAKAGMELSETLAMLPAASVSAFVYAHPASKYFAVDKVEKDQVQSYATRKGMNVQEVERWLNPILNYQD